MREKCILKFNVATDGGVVGESVGWGPFVEVCGLIFVMVMVMMVTNRHSQQCGCSHRTP
jgi:hypothetical protein